MRRIYVGIQHGQYFGRSVQFGIGKTFSLWRCKEFGLALHDYWTRIIGDKVPDRDDLAWADIIQFIARQSRNTD